MTKTIRDEFLSKNFRKREFRCKCRRGADCDAVPVQLHFVTKLQALRDLWFEATGKPLIVSSGERCRFWNSASGGAARSQHLYGLAADLDVDGEDEVAQLAALAETLKFSGIGRGPSFLHVDEGPEGRRWTY